MKTTLPANRCVGPFKSPRREHPPPEEARQSVNERLRTHCLGSQIPHVEIASKLHNKHFAPELHSNDDGAQVIAQEVFRVLSEVTLTSGQTVANGSDLSWMTGRLAHFDHDLHPVHERTAGGRPRREMLVAQFMARAIQGSGRDGEELGGESRRRGQSLVILWPISKSSGTLPTIAAALR
jgi:hypothetical protein